MSEFKTRIQAQRTIVQAVNQKSSNMVELFGLSKKAINRWAEENRVSQKSHIYTLLIEASDKLFFLANKSQEQVTEDYRKISCEISAIFGLIKSAQWKGQLNVLE